MAYQQSQPTKFEFGLANTSDTSYEGQPLAYHENNSNHRSLVSPVPDAQMMSHGESHSQYRKDSFANTGGLHSPASSLHEWPSKFPPHGHDHGVSMPTHGFRYDPNPFSQNDSNQYYDSGNYLGVSSESSTPGRVFHGIPPKLEASQYPSNIPDQSDPSPSNYTPIQREPNFSLAPQIQTPMSPHSQEEWKLMTALEKEGRFPTHMRMTSPSGHMDSKRKGDGIRKKNAKIDIPDGRTVVVIETLMAKEHDENRLKELKGQKRLLRNREAALASRQRKKKHTEDLEEKVAGLNTVISDLEGQVQRYSTQLNAETLQRKFFEQRLREAEIQIDGLRQEKEHMAIQHTQVTGNLRQKIGFMEEHMLSPAPAMSAAPSSTGYTDINSELDHFSLNGQDWDKQIRFLNPETDWEMIQGECASEATIQPSKLYTQPFQQEQTKSGESDPSIPTGVLFMLLLCGAFVAANSSSQATTVPRMPEEIRAVSGTVLNNLLQEMKSDAAPSFPDPYNMGFGDASSQGTAWTAHMPESSTIANMHRHLTSPTRHQLMEQAFMPTPEQYNSLTQPIPAMNLPHRPVASRRNLAEILKNARQERIAKGSNADVYTRSLLWEQVPENVVKQFKQAVRESEQSQAGPSNSNNNNPNNNNNPISNHNLRS